MIKRKWSKSFAAPSNRFRPTRSGSFYQRQCVSLEVFTGAAQWEAAEKERVQRLILERKERLEDLGTGLVFFFPDCRGLLAYI
ncbi:hypothetical protein [Aliiroseovarius sp. 2305UL8-7]|uniref:hypothetical protein n=1 Tax=Aliiroseovarius conchicola TaxID=3121637 RepID=UPI0035280F1D